MPKRSEIVLADTSAWIHFFRGSGVSVQERFVPLIMTDKIAVTPVVVMELLQGAKSQKEYDRLCKDMAALTNLEMSSMVWKRAYLLAFTLRRKGLNIPLTDTLIAAVALEFNALLLHDDRHYDLISTVTQLKQERIVI